MTRKPVIAVLVPYRERFDPSFYLETWLPLYEAQIKNILITQIKGQVSHINWDEIKGELFGAIDFCHLAIGKYLMSDMPHISAARNWLAEAALHRNVDLLYWLDADMIVKKPKSSVETLRLLVEAIQKPEVDIVSGMYLAKASSQVCAVRRGSDGEREFLKVGECRENWEKGELTRADAVGMGCCLMKASIFSHPDMPYPWFVCDVRPGSTPLTPGEDIYFCNNAVEKAGFKVWVHGGVEFDHVGLFRLSVDDEIKPSR